MTTTSGGCRRPAARSPRPRAGRSAARRACVGAARDRRPAVEPGSALRRGASRCSSAAGRRREQAERERLERRRAAAPVGAADEEVRLAQVDARPARGRYSLDADATARRIGRAPAGARGRSAGMRGTGGARSRRVARAQRAAPSSRDRRGAAIAGGRRRRARSGSPACRRRSRAPAAAARPRRPCGRARAWRTRRRRPAAARSAATSAATACGTALRRSAVAITCTPAARPSAMIRGSAVDERAEVDGLEGGREAGVGVEQEHDPRRQRLAARPGGTRRAW